MRLKPIEPGMVIHCKNDMEYEQLNTEVIKLGYGSLPCKDRANQHIVRNFVFCVGSDGVGWEYKNMVAGEIIEFSDLIIPELSAEEVLEICNEICTVSQCGNTNQCPMMENCFVSAGADYSKVIEICEQWKADHEKKEPENELHEAAKPLIEYLRKNYHPHTTAIVTLMDVEVLEGKEVAKYE